MTESTSLSPSLFRTLFVVAMVGSSLVLIDSVLANTERRETASAAARSYRDGLRLMQQGKYADATDAFRSAIANARDNTAYPLALSQSLLDAGQVDEAGETLTELLRADSMAGAPNLAMARVLAKESRFEEAAFYYHRAIYGQWRDDAPGNSVRTRFELADLLAVRNSKAELLAELLPLQDEASPDAATQTKLARLFMTAGAPARAVPIFQDLVRAHPDDTEAHEGLGEAEFALGNYPAAQSGFIAALRLRPGDLTARKRLELCDRVLNLDPMRPGLAAEERYERSVHVLQLVADKVAQCLTPAQTGASADLIGDTNAALKKRLKAGGQSDAVDSNLNLANKLWRAESANCRAVSPADEPLKLVLAKAVK